MQIYAIIFVDACSMSGHVFTKMINERSAKKLDHAEKKKQYSKTCQEMYYKPDCTMSCCVGPAVLSFSCTTIARGRFHKGT